MGNSKRTINPRHCVDRMEVDGDPASIDGVRRESHTLFVELGVDGIDESPQMPPHRPLRHAVSIGDEALGGGVRQHAKRQAHLND